ncbi:hypothetical protein CYMTET_40375 [Cymbomonas tetramitiformis]|uniref:DNA-directed DNA polymerase n=1 Tax=Cymbomonas tetramitiformis TaxID=36881 RepID=A0AAE0F4P1_9CHLO|nr:hypothetical protein CYMTET_40375 [Cymbomonas tetramitiformis]
MNQPENVLNVVSGILEGGVERSRRSSSSKRPPGASAENAASKRKRSSFNCTPLTSTAEKQIAEIERAHNASLGQLPAKGSQPGPLARILSESQGASGIQGLETPTSAEALSIERACQQAEGIYRENDASLATAAPELRLSVSPDPVKRIDFTPPERDSTVKLDDASRREAEAPVEGLHDQPQLRSLDARQNAEELLPRSGPAEPQPAAPSGWRRAGPSEELPPEWPSAQCFEGQPLGPPLEQSTGPAGGVVGYQREWASEMRQAAASEGPVRGVAISGRDIGEATWRGQRAGGRAAGYRWEEGPEEAAAWRGEQRAVGGRQAMIGRGIGGSLEREAGAGCQWEGASERRLGALSEGPVGGPVAYQHARALEGQSEGVGGYTRGDAPASSVEGDPAAHAAGPSELQMGEAAAPSVSPSQPPPASTRLSDWEIPDSVVEAWKLPRGEMYPWQARCLATPGVREGRNLVYTAPTSSGKSLVAEVLLVRQLLQRDKLSVIALPFVSLCAEKVAHLTKLLEPLGKTVKSFFGSQGGALPGSDTGVMVCTFEKANALISRFVQEGRLEDIGLVVVDELHMLAESDRGGLLELMLTKLLYACGGPFNASRPAPYGGGSASSQCTPATPGGSAANHSLQLVGMSATLPNAQQLADWLGAALYETDFRPVPLTHMMKVERAIVDAEGVALRPPLPAPAPGDEEHVAMLTEETILAGHSVLIFCPTKASCQTTADWLAKRITVPSPLDAAGRSAPGGGALDEEDGRTVAVEEMRRGPAGLDEVLARTIPAGIAYHHAGLTAEERESVEAAYRGGWVRVLCATSTLAAGVNLPARRVIFRKPWRGNRVTLPFRPHPISTQPLGLACHSATACGRKQCAGFVSLWPLRQMAGRAGRAGLDTVGESILICPGTSNAGAEMLRQLMIQPPAPLSSSLAKEDAGMRRLMLEAVSCGLVSQPQHVHRYLQCTLLAALEEFQEVVAKRGIEALKALGKDGHLQWKDDTREFVPGALGLASGASSMHPDLALRVRQDVAAARQLLILSTELHLLYLVTPYQENTFYDSLRHLPGIFDRLTADEKRVGRMVLGRDEREVEVMLNRLRRGSVVGNKEREEVARRFMAALMLAELVQEAPLAKVVDKYKVPRGSIQGLQERAARFAGQVAAFCEQMGWWDMEGLIARLQNRISAGARPEIVSLMDIPGVKAHRARVLYQAGLRTPEAVLVMSEDKLTDILSAGTRRTGRSAVPWMERRAARQILLGSRQLLQDRAKELHEEGERSLRALLPEPQPSPARVTPSPQHPPGASARMGASAGGGHGAAASAVPGGPDEPESSRGLHPGQRGAMREAGTMSAGVSGMQQALGAEDAVGGARAGAGGGMWPPPQQAAMGGGRAVARPTEARSGQAEASVQQPQPGAGGGDIIPPRLEGGGSSRPWGLPPPLPPPQQQTERRRQQQLGAERSESPGPAAVNMILRERAQRAAGGCPGTTHPPGGMALGERQQPTSTAAPAAIFAGEKPGLAPAPHRQPVETPQVPREGAACVRDSEHLHRTCARVAARGSYAFAIHYSEAVVATGDGGLFGRGSGAGNVGAAGISRTLKVEGVALCCEEKDVVYIPLRDPEWRRKVTHDVLGRQGPCKLTYGLKSQLKAVLATQRAAPSASGGEALRPIRLAGPLQDVRIAAWLLEPDAIDVMDGSKVTVRLRQAHSAHSKSSLDSLLGRTGLLAQVQRFSKWSGGASATGLSAGARHGAAEAVKVALAAFHLHQHLTPLLDKEGLYVPFTRIEAPLVAVLARMELAGVAFNAAEVDTQMRPLKRKLQELQDEAHTLAGTRFSLTSVQEVHDVLYQRLQLVPPPAPGDRQPKEKAGRGGACKYSTDAETLGKLAEQHALPRVIIEHRKLSKLKACALENLPLHLQKSASGADPAADGFNRCALPRVSGSVLQTSVETGRLSMEEPNLQTVPKPYMYTLPMTASQSQGGDVEVNVRRAFVAAPGCTLMAVDYSQLELRIMAHYSCDEGLLKVLKLKGHEGDPFRQLAAIWKGIAIDAVGPSDRNWAKQLAYGLLYGKGANTFASEMGTDVETANQAMAAFRRMFPKVDEWLKRVVKDCRERRPPHIVTLGGRRRYLKDIALTGPQHSSARAAAERQAVNSMCQGSAADLVKVAMIAISKRIEGEGPEQERKDEQRCSLLLQIHDELLLEVESAAVDAVAQMVQECMEGAIQLNAPLMVKINVGPTWGDLQPFVPHARGEAETI